MARLLVEILINASGTKARTAFEDVGSGATSADRAVSSFTKTALASESALRRTATAAERFRDQMEATTAGKNIVSDLTALNTKLKEELTATKAGADGIERLNQKRREEATTARIAATQVRAGVAAESEMGKAIATQIRLQDRLQSELRQTAAAQGSAGGSSGGGISAQIRILTGDLGNLQTALGPLGSSLAPVTSGLAAMGAAIGPLLPLVVSLAAAAGLAAAGLAALSYLKTVISDGLETQAVIERLNITLRSTGSYAGMSAADLMGLAEGYELLTGRQKEEIIAAEIVLSRFQELGRTAYPQALRAVLAYAKATGETAEASASKLGPALAGNARSLNALKDIGIVLSASQRKMLQEMVEQGRVTEYQSLLFAILKEKIGDVSEGYDKNLTRQAARARIVLDDFGEAIASEVIPALEDLFQELVDSVGGWDVVKLAVNDAGRTIGNVLREIIYGVRITYHEWAGEQDKLASQIASSFAEITKSISSVAQTFARLPIPGASVWGVVVAEANLATVKLTKTADVAKKSAKEHGDAIALATRQLLEHRKALEADTKVYGSHGSAVDDVIGKNKEEEKKAKDLAKIYKEQMEALRHLTALKALADRGPLDLTTRLKEEQRINDEHEYRLSLLKNEEKFGAKIAKDLADQERFLKNFKRTVDIELKTSVKLDPIDMNPAALKELNRIMAETEKQLKADYEAFAAFNRAQDEWLQGFADDWRQSFRTWRDDATDNTAAIRAAVKAGYLTVAEGENAIALLRADLLASQLSGWASFMSDLGSLVGGGFGRIMSQVSRALQTIQAGQSAGTQLGGLLNASPATTAMLGAVGMYVAVAKIAYDYFKSSQANRYSRGYNYGAVTGMESGQGWEIGAGLTGQAREASRQIQSAARTLAEAMGGVITSFADIEIKVRRDGKYFQSFIEGELVGKFESIDDAISAAIIAGFKSNKTSLFGISDLVRQGLNQALDATSGSTVDYDASDLQAFLGSLREIAELGWSDSARQVSATTNHLHDLMTELLKLDDASPAVIQGFDDIRASLVRTFQDWRRSITGEQMSPAEARALQEADAKLFSAKKALEIARLKQEYEAYKVHASIVAGEGQTTRQFFNIKTAELEGYAAFIQARGQLAAAEAEVYGQTTEAIRAALEATIAALESIPDIDLSQLGRGNGQGGGGSGRGDERRDFRQQIRDRMAEFLGEVDRMFYDLDREMGDLSARAKELGIPLSELNELFGKMQENTRKQLKQRMDDLAGKGMSDIGKQLEEGLDFFEQLRKKGRKETGIPDWKVDVREQQFRDQIRQSFQQSVNEFAGVADPMLQIKMRAAELRKGLQELADQGLLSAEEIQRAKDMIAGGEEIQRQQAVGGIMSQVFGYLKDSAKYAQEEAELKKEMELINLRMLEAQLRMLGAWDDHTAEIFGDAAEAIKNGIVAGFAGAGAGGGLNDMIEAAEKYYEELKNRQNEAADILKGWRDAGKTPLQRQLDELAEQMGKVTAAFGSTAEITGLHAQRLRAIISDYLAPIQSALDQQPLGATSSFTGEQRFFESQRQFRELAAQAQAAITSGNLGAIPDPQELTRLFNQYLEAGKGYTAGEGYRFIEKEARGIFQSILSAIPGMAGLPGAGAGGGPTPPTGAASNPYTVQSPALQASIETGNNLLLAEARTQTTILARIRDYSAMTAGRLQESLSVRMVA